MLKFEVVSMVAFCLIGALRAQETPVPPSPQKPPDLQKPPSELVKAEPHAGQGIEITSQKEASFDSGARVAVFVGQVNVKDPQFELKGDKLTVYLEKEGGGLDRAEAEGNVFIYQEKADPETGKIEKSTGQAERATYNPKTGEVTLVGWPQIQKGINLHKATESSTRMVLNRDGRMKTFGQSKTLIQDRTGQ